MKRTNWSVTHYLGAPAITCDAEFDDAEAAFDPKTVAETFFVAAVCPRGECGRREPGVGCACGGLEGAELAEFHVRNGPHWWSCWDDELAFAEPVEVETLLATVPAETLAQWVAESFAEVGA
jgi:hypothetical protein